MKTCQEKVARPGGYLLHTSINPLTAVLFPLKTDSNAA